MNFRNIFKQNYSEPSGSFFVCVSEILRYKIFTAYTTITDS